MGTHTHVAFCSLGFQLRAAAAPVKPKSHPDLFLPVEPSSEGAIDPVDCPLVSEIRYGSSFGSGSFWRLLVLVGSVAVQLRLGA